MRDFSGKILQQPLIALRANQHPDVLSLLNQEAGDVTSNESVCAGNE